MLAIHLSENLSRLQGSSLWNFTLTMTRVQFFDFEVKHFKSEKEQRVSRHIHTFSLLMDKG